jgi:succinate dehydrogenase flavin-adding protein (antitoxin of CptAB toxin-antitoxin module)
VNNNDPKPTERKTQNSFDIVLACRKKDLGVLRLVIPRLRKFIPHQRCVVFTSILNLNLFRRSLGKEVVLVDEDTVIPGMRLQDLRAKVSLPGFPAGAGWYFQQFLKLSYPRLYPRAERYLIWDADTVPLRPIDVFGSKGESLLTVATMEAASPPSGVNLDLETLEMLKKATCPHEEYFSNFEHLLGQKTPSFTSFISQHMPIQVETLNQMTQKIENRFPGPESWCWKVIQNLHGPGANLFSEYEFYAHYALQHAPTRHRVRYLAWSRGGRLRGSASQREKQLENWSKALDFVAVEAWASPLRRKIFNLFHRLPESWRIRFLPRV